MAEYKKIGIIGAMEEEIKRMKDRFQAVVPTVKAGITYYTSEQHGNEIVLCKCGVGKVNAAVCTQILIDLFEVEMIIFTGVAGALHPDLNVGDIVISTECMQHDMDVTALGFPRGTIPFAEQSVFPADEALVQLAYNMSEQLYPGRTMKGRILSGDQFIADLNIVTQLYENMNGCCTEMEGAAVAQVCAINGIPFVIIRSMSDKADGSAHTNFSEFTNESADRSLKIVEALLQNM